VVQKSPALTSPSAVAQASKQVSNTKCMLATVLSLCHEYCNIHLEV